MAIAATCDIPRALEKLGLNHCQYGLTQSVPPHSIRWWDCVDPQPTDDEINNAWYTIPDTSYIDKRIGFTTTDGYPVISDQLDQLYTRRNYQGNLALYKSLALDLLSGGLRLVRDGLMKL